jgi:hypothetical protein
LPQEESQNGPEIKEEHGILPEDYQTPSINEQPNISNNITKKKKTWRIIWKVLSRYQNTSG